METIIVSQHAAEIEFIAREMGAQYLPYPTNRAGRCVAEGFVCPPPSGGSWVIPVVASVTAVDVHGMHIYGNLPLHLAASAAVVTTVEFEGVPPRGQEYTMADMDAAGATLRSYIIRPARQCPWCVEAGRPAWHTDELAERDGLTLCDRHASAWGERREEQGQNEAEEQEREFCRARPLSEPLPTSGSLVALDATIYGSDAEGRRTTEGIVQVLDYNFADRSDRHTAVFVEDGLPSGALDCAYVRVVEGDTHRWVSAWNVGREKE